jgi:hypothetical protein
MNDIAGMEGMRAVPLSQRSTSSTQLSSTQLSGSDAGVPLPLNAWADQAEPCNDPELDDSEDPDPADDELLGLQGAVMQLDFPEASASLLRLLDEASSIDQLASRALAEAFGRLDDPQVDDVQRRYNAFADSHGLPRDISRFSEEALIVFFHEHYFGKRAPSTYFPHLSNLQASVAGMYPSLNFKNYTQLRRLIKSKLLQYLVTKAKPLTAEHIAQICKVWCYMSFSPP